MLIKLHSVGSNLMLFIINNIGDIETTLYKADHLHSENNTQYTKF